MAHGKLTPEEVQKRLIRLRNLEVLYRKQQITIRHLRDENKALKHEILVLNTVVATQQQTIETLKLHIEELQRMVFGRKKGKEDDDDDLLPQPHQATTPRTRSSYQRSTPHEDEVTETQHHTVSHCTCGVLLTKTHTVFFYEEDIPLPTTKVVRKHVVDRGYCPACTRWQTARSLPTARVVLGANVQKYVCYLSILCRLSFTQIQHLLSDTYAFSISQGEIAKILEREALHLRPQYEQLTVRIRGEPGVHLDETSWKLLQGGETRYAWVMSGTESHESVFLAGVSRGKGNAEHLLGTSFRGFAVTDDYGAYRTLAYHQLCWAHLLRKCRDLATARTLPEQLRAQCRATYVTLCALFDDVEHKRTMEQYDEFAQRLAMVAQPTPHDPAPLLRIKTTLMKNIPRYLTCLSDPRIPLTNNQAERSLRHLVLKRKISFGSLTERTAEQMAVLMSVLLSLRQRYATNFFAEYMKV